MGRPLLVVRLAARDLRRRSTETLLLLLAIVAASAVLTLGLALHGVTAGPYDQTRTATRGPDVVAQSAARPDGTTSAADLSALVALDRAPGVVAHAGPYPMTTVVFRTPSVTAGANVLGRDLSPAPVDQPLVTAGTWIRPGGVVVERTFAEAAGLRLGQAVTLNGQPFRVDGFAVTAAFEPFPQLGCALSDCSFGSVQLDASNTGLVWTTRTAVAQLATSAAPLTYFSNLKLAHPGQAGAFARRYGAGEGGPAAPTSSQSATLPSLASWTTISFHDSNLLRNERLVLLVASWLLALLAIASVAVLVGGRMADQMRRVGLLKAVGGTPRFVAAVLMAEYLIVALVGAAFGLLLGWLFAPVLTAPGAGLLGTAPTPPMTASTVIAVIAVAPGIAVAATLVPTLRAARTSTVRALADAARSPRRSHSMVALSRWLPVPLLIAFRAMGRRLRRTVLSVLSIFVTVSGIVAVLIAHRTLGSVQVAHASGLVNPRIQRADQVLLIVTLMLACLAVVNAVFITRAIVQDNRHASAITRALGATPFQVAAGLSAAQVVPAGLGALLGIPGGLALYNLAKHGGEAPQLPSMGVLFVVVVGTVAVVTLLTALPARWGARRPVAGLLQAELA